MRLVLLLLVPLAACSRPVYRDTEVPMEPAEAVDLERYAGRWYEVARFPVFFQEGCVGVTADYALRKDGRVDVVNTCREETLEGPVRQADAVARPVSPDGARLKVSFFPLLPFLEGDYWVLYVDGEYQTAVVGVPSGTAGWILSRTPQIEPERLAEAEAVLEGAGYDLRWLERTPQPQAGETDLSTLRQGRFMR